MIIMHDIITHSHPVHVMLVNTMCLGGVRDFKWNRPQELRTLHLEARGKRQRKERN